MNPLKRLPDSILGYLLNFVDIKTVACTLPRLNKKWNDVLSNPRYNINNYRTYLEISIDIPYPGILNHNYKKINIDVIIKITNKYPNLKYLNINIRNIKDDVLDKMLSKCPMLQHLDLSGCTYIRNKGFEYIANRCQQLVTVNLDKVTSLDDDGLFRLVESNTNISSLTVKGCSRIGSKGLTDAAMYLQNLRHIDLSECRQISQKGLLNFFSNCHSLEKVILNFSFLYSGKRNIIDKTLIAIVDNNPNLNHLELTNIQVTDAGYLYLAQNSKNLKYVDFGLNDVDYDITTNTIVTLCRNCKKVRLSFRDFIKYNTHPSKDIFKRVEPNLKQILQNYNIYRNDFYIEIEKK